MAATFKDPKLGLIHSQYEYYQTLSRFFFASRYRANRKSFKISIFDKGILCSVTAITDQNYFNDSSSKR